MSDDDAQKFKTVIKELPSVNPQPCNDAISKQAVINACEQSINILEAVDRIMDLSSVEQEPFINKPCVSSEVCEHDKNKVLDKIRAEIDEQIKYNTYFNSDMAKGEIIAFEWVKRKIDEYTKGESL